MLRAQAMKNESKLVKLVKVLLKNDWKTKKGIMTSCLENQHDMYASCRFIRHGMLKVWTKHKVLEIRTPKKIVKIKDICIPTTVICFSKLWGRSVGDHPKEDLAKFGYILEKKVQKFRNWATHWWHARIRVFFFFCAPDFDCRTLMHVDPTTF